MEFRDKDDHDQGEEPTSPKSDNRNQDPPGSTENAEGHPMNSQPVQTRFILVKPVGSLPLPSFSVGTVRDSLLKADRLLELNEKERVNLMRWRAQLLVMQNVGEKFNKDASRGGSRLTPATPESTAGGPLIIQSRQGGDPNVKKATETKQMERPITSSKKEYVPSPAILQALERTRKEAARQKHLASHSGAVLGGSEKNPGPLQPGPSGPPPTTNPVVKKIVNIPPPPKLTAAPTIQTGIPFKHLRATEAAATSNKKDGGVPESFAPPKNLPGPTLPKTAAQTPVIRRTQLLPPVPPPKRSIGLDLQSSDLHPPSGGFKKPATMATGGPNLKHPPATGLDMKGGHEETGSGSGSLASAKRRRTSGGSGVAAAAAGSSSSRASSYRVAGHVTVPLAVYQASSAAPGAVLNQQKCVAIYLCERCLKREGRFRCGGCGKRYYCSTECQIADWASHSYICN